MSKGGASAPPSVDPTALAQGQAQANIATAQQQANINNVRTNSPLGKSYFEQGPDGRWNLNQNLDPSVEGAFKNQANLSSTLAENANTIANSSVAPVQYGQAILNRILGPESNLVGQIPTGPVSLEGLPSLSYSSGSGIPLATGASSDIGLSTGSPASSDYMLPSSVGPVGEIQSGLGPFGRVQSEVGPFGRVQSGLDFNGLTALPSSASDFSGSVKQAQDAAYNTQAGYLDPQFQQKRSDLSQQLADQGIPVGSAAYSRAMGDLGREQTLAYQQAQNAAIAAGDQEQSTLYGENLSSRQQGANERTTAGQFTNAAQQQEAGQTLARGQFANTAQQQEAGQTLARGQFANSAQQQGADQALARANYAAQAQGQNFGQGATNAQIRNAAQGQQYDQNLKNAGLQNEAEQQQFGQSVTQDQLVNQARQQALNERITQWGQPLTALQATAQAGQGLISGAAADEATLNPLSGFEWAGSLPTFGGSPTAVSPANVVGAGAVGATAANNRFTAGNTLNNQLFNGIGSFGGALGFGNGGLGSAIGNLFGGGASAGADYGGGGAALGVPDVMEALPAAAGAWVVCTELMRQGKMPKRHWIAGAPVFAAYPEAGKNGYYVWAVPLVRHMRRKPDSLLSKTAGAVFRWRAEDIAARQGVPRARKLLRGRAVTAVLYPLCKMLGCVVPAQDWTALYREEHVNG